nr:Hpt domain-containing protein [Kordiimonas marina]
MEAAEEALHKMAEDYPDWVSGLIVKLQEQHGRCVDTPEKRRDCFEEINRIAHDMKGQGGTFGYPLITTVSDSLYGFTQSREEISDNQVELVKAHLDAMRAVIRGRVSGSGGDIGQKLIEGLNQAILKYSKK